jgi:hypothetical protein
MYNVVRTALRIQSAPAMKPNQKVLCKGTIGFIVNHKTQMDTLCGKVKGFLLLQQMVLESMIVPLNSKCTLKRYDMKTYWRLEWQMKTLISNPPLKKFPLQTNCVTLKEKLC